MKKTFKKSFMLTAIGVLSTITSLSMLKIKVVQPGMLCGLQQRQPKGRGAANCPIRYVRCC